MKTSTLCDRLTRADKKSFINQTGLAFITVEFSTAI